MHLRGISRVRPASVYQINSLISVINRVFDILSGLQWLLGFRVADLVRKTDNNG